ncbi:MAG: hypothetical protein V4813_15470 [Gemmatimonadota bacterium]
MHHLRQHALLPVLMMAAACARTPDAPPASGDSRYLYLWTAAADTTQPDFLAVLDVRPEAATYGTLVTTVAVPGVRNGPHHTEHEMPADGRLFANGFRSGQTFMFDATDAAAPRLDGSFGELAGMMHPHSFLRLPSGNLLATFQMTHDSTGARPGGIAEVTPTGTLVRSVSADVPAVASSIRPYSGAVVPSLDRIVTTTTDMMSNAPGRTVQVWRLSDLTLLHSFDLPDGPRGDEGTLSAEPRLLADGKTVLVSTFSCGLFLIDSLAGTKPSARMVASFPTRQGADCAIPVVTGHHYLVTVPAWSAVVSLDISDPVHPSEVSRVSLDSADIPHWIALEPNGKRVVITGYGALENRVMIATFDSTTGRLALDERFRAPGAPKPGFVMAARTWPHGGTGAGVPHGAVFSRP